MAAEEFDLDDGAAGDIAGRLEAARRTLTDMLAELDELQSLRAAAYVAMAIDALNY